MKPKDILSFLKIGLGFGGPLTVAVWFYVHPTPAGPEHNSIKEFIGNIVFCSILTISTFYMAFLAKKIGKADGLALGYFYNFIYETEIFINNHGTINSTKKNAEGRNEYESLESQPDNIHFLIIIPDNYVISDVVKNILKEVTVLPPENIHSRLKVWRWFSFEDDEKIKHVLVDVPPTTMRTLRFFRESSKDVDHYKRYSKLEPKERAVFENVRKDLKKDVKLFSDSLVSIVDQASDKKKIDDRKVTIRYAKDFIHDLFSEDQLNEFDELSLDDDEDHKKATTIIDKIIQEKRTTIEDRIKEAILGTLDPVLPLYKRIWRKRIKPVTDGIQKLFYRIFRI